ncbi:MAG: hypothetical protein N2Z59_07685 [Alteraurantiacibacter sp.]|nr:hypothetical protein [Alteraurantiacibacter sp.]
MLAIFPRLEWLPFASFDVQGIAKLGPLGNGPQPADRLETAKLAPSQQKAKICTTAVATENDSQ